MGFLTQYEEEETRTEHGDDPDGEVRYVEIDGEELEASLQGGQLVLKEAERKAITTGATKSVRVKEICSCGSFTCPLIRKYGLPETVYEREIKPLPSGQRDQAALRLKGSGWAE